MLVRGSADGGRILSKLALLDIVEGKKENFLGEAAGWYIGGTKKILARSEMATVEVLKCRCAGECGAECTIRDDM